MSTFARYVYIFVGVVALLLLCTGIALISASRHTECDPKVSVRIDGHCIDKSVVLDG